MADDNFLRIDLGTPHVQVAVPLADTTVGAAAYQATSADSQQAMMDPYAIPASGLVVTEMVATGAPTDQRRLIWIGLSLICASLVLAFYLFNGHSSKDPFEVLFALMTGQTLDEGIEQKPKPRKKPAVAVVAKIPENPYWDLPNQVPAFSQGVARHWTAGEEVMWRNGLKHPFNFQRYKTIRDVRSYKLKGSEVILLEGLEQKKLWTRMHAAFGLAEMGIAVDLDHMEKVIGDTRSDLVDRFFQRYENKQTEGERYILRQALRVVEAKPRLTILKALANNDDKLTQLYLAAATFDPVPQIKLFSEMQLRAKKVSRADMETYKNFLLGTASLPVGFNAEKDTIKLVAEKGIAARKTQKLSSSSFVDKVEYFEGTKSESLNESGLLDDAYKHLEVIEIK